MAHVPPNWQIYFRVPDITAAIERIKANGGQILNGPIEVPGGDWVVNAMDPQGAAFARHARRADCVARRTPRRGPPRAATREPSHPYPTRSPYVIAPGDVHAPQ